METVLIHSEMDASGIGRTHQDVVSMIPLNLSLMTNAALVKPFDQSYQLLFTKFTLKINNFLTTIINFYFN